MYTIHITPSAREDILWFRKYDQQQIIGAVERNIYYTRNNAALMALLDERAREPATIDLATLKAELKLP